MSIKFHIDGRYAEVLATLGLKNFRSVMETNAGTPVSVHKDRDAIRLQVELNGEQHELYLKRTFYRPVIGLIRGLFFNSPHKTIPHYEYQICNQLQKAGIPAMKAIGYGQWRRWGLPYQSFVAIEAVPGKMSLQKAFWVRADGNDRLSLSQKRQVIRCVAKLAAKLHNTGFRWPDFAAKHIMLNLPPSDDSRHDWQLHLIDLERVHTGKSDHTRYRDLLTLFESLPAGCLSRTDLHRFVKCYCGNEQQPWKEQKADILGFLASLPVKMIRWLQVM